MTAVDQFEVVGFGVDDVTLGFDMTRFAIRRPAQLDAGDRNAMGKATGRAGILGDMGQRLRSLRGSLEAREGRLYVQAKLSAEGTLCDPHDFQGHVTRSSSEWPSLALSATNQRG